MRHRVSRCRGQFEALRLYDIDTDGSAYLNGSVPLTDLHGGAGDDPVPEIEPFALDGRPSSASRVPGQYTQLEPSVYPERAADPLRHP